MFNSYMANQTFVAFDTETTGLWAPASRIVEIGAVKFTASNSKTEQFQELVNPECSIPDVVVKIHGITDEMVAEVETAKPILLKFIEFCGTDSILIAHNAPFDISFIECELERVGLKFGQNPIIDTIDIYKKYFPEVSSLSLLSLARNFNLADFQNHRALADSELVRRLFLNAVNCFPIFDNREQFLKSLTSYHMDDWHQRVTSLPDKFQPLIEVVNNDQKIKMNYTSPGQPTYPRIVTPKQFYSLKSKYYMRAICGRTNQERTYRLDRVEDFEILPAPADRS